MSNALMTTTPDQITFLEDTRSHRFRFDIPSSNGSDTYRVSQATGSGQWQCGCPSWIYQRGPQLERKPCKHLRAMTDVLLQIDDTGHACPSLDASQRPVHPNARPTLIEAHPNARPTPIEAQAPVTKAKAAAPKAVSAPKVSAPKAAPVSASGRNAARQTLDALARDAEAEVAMLRGKLVEAEAKMAAFQAASKVA